MFENILLFHDKKIILSDRFITNVTAKINKQIILIEKFKYFKQLHIY